MMVRTLAMLTASCTAVFALAGCGNGATSNASGSAASSAGGHSSGSSSNTAAVVRRPHSSVVHKLPGPFYPQLLGAAMSSAPSGFMPVVRWHGKTAAWIARSPSGVALLSFDQGLVELRLHAGTLDPGGSGWRWGPAVVGSERRQLVAAFNGAFKFSTGAGGFLSYGRTGASLQADSGSIVTYKDGHTDIGLWRAGVPQAGRSIASVRQNLKLLINHGGPAATLNCLRCWGATLAGVNDPARSALGITADGRLIWAGGEHLSVTALADALLGARVVRAVELDINPAWVAGYLYGHRTGRGPLAPVPIVPGQVGVPGFFLAPYSRDFFTIQAR